MSRRLQTLISFPKASFTIIIVNSAVIIFHILVISGIVPYNVVWAGRLENVNEMYVFEFASILINLLLISTVFFKWKKIKINSSNKLPDVILRIFVVLFTLNTLGNLTAESSVETYIAPPITAMLAMLCWRVAIEKVQASTEATEKGQAPVR